MKTVRIIRIAKFADKENSKKFSFLPLKGRVMPPLIKPRGQDRLSTWRSTLNY
jgi:hypothetical protein